MFRWKTYYLHAMACRTLQACIRVQISENYTHYFLNRKFGKQDSSTRQKMEPSTQRSKAAPECLIAEPALCFGKRRSHWESVFVFCFAPKITFFFKADGVLASGIQHSECFCGVGNTTSFCCSLLSWRADTVISFPAIILVSQGS